MEQTSRVAAMSIIIENPDAVEEVNKILHEGREYIIGRMGVPYRQKNVNIITIVLDAPQPVTSGISGRIGKLPGVFVKTVYSNV
jgi:putative iron-only hydrogenase system regulator